jgi:chromosome condensin MukBEF ATPase and DNA-binding subunit MukB
MENSLSYYRNILLQEIEEVSYKKSGLENPDKADRDKDHDISSWEKKVGTAIEKNMEEGEDHEVSMANNSIESIVKAAMELKTQLGNNEKNIPAWIQDHISKAENYITQASQNYHEYGDHEVEDMPINGALEKIMEKVLNKK